MKPTKLLLYKELKELRPLEMADYFNEHAQEIAATYYCDDFTDILSRTAKAIAVGAPMNGETPEDAKEENKRQLWERMHLRILKNVSEATERNHAIPPVSYIAKDLNVPRPEVAEHLEALSNGHRIDFYASKVAILKERALTSLYDLTIYADTDAARIKAIKLLLDYGKQSPAPQPRMQNTVNILQVNNTNISLERIAQLPPVKQAEIAEILLTA